MSSIPNNFIDDIKRIVQSVLNQLENLKVRNLFGVEQINGVAWSGAGGVTDHGALTGLADDDHPHYLLASGARNIIGDIRITGSHSYEMAGNAGDVIEIYADAGDFFIDNLTDAQGLLWIDGDTGLATFVAGLSLGGGIDMGGILDMNTSVISACGDITFNTGKGIVLPYTAYDTLSIKKEADLLMFNNDSDAQGLMWLNEDSGLLGLLGGLDIGGNIDMNSHQINELTDPTLAQDAATKKYVDDNGVTDHGALTGLADDDHPHYLLASGARNIIGDIRITGSHSYEMAGNAGDVIEIYADAGDFFIDNLTDAQGLLWIDGDTGLVTLWKGLNIGDNIIPGTDSAVNLGSATYAFNDLYVDRILGGAENDDAALDLDFRGDANHRIRYNGTAANELEYKTYVRHRFMIQATEILNIDADELAVETGMKVGLNSVGGGTYLKDDASGNMELHVATGKTVKIIVG